MKILTVDKIREADSYTIKNEPIASVDLMERAGRNCSEFIKNNIAKDISVCVFAGPGNNGGDGLVIARHLAAGAFRVKVFVVDFTKNYSDDFRINLERCEQVQDIEIHHLTAENSLPDIKKGSVIVDAVFGSGLNRPVKGFPAAVISHINAAGCMVFSIDIPSGMFADKSVDPKEGAVVHADVTLSLQFPKLSMLIPENEEFTGDLHIIPIGLHPDFIAKVKPAAELLEEAMLRGLLRERRKYDHKGKFGHALLIAGSSDKTGAAVLAAKAALRSGTGLLTVHLPSKAAPALQAHSAEAMLSIDPSEEVFSSLPSLSRFNAVAVGPGLGTREESQRALKLLIQEFKAPIIFDADALNILSENKTWLSFIPPASILTPHLKEFERLTGKSADHFQRMEKAKELSRKYGVYIILKGAHSLISCPDGVVYFNNTGNPGMATGGSGDVLTGILLGLLAQGYSSRDAALLGVWLHGLAGDLALQEQSVESLIASDIVAKLGKAFDELRKN